MNTSNGRIYEELPEQLKRRPPRVLSSEKCPCGSGETFAKCHMTKS
jgi:hypothetical protein